MNDSKHSVLVETALLKALSVKQNYDDYYMYVMYDKLLPETQTLLDAYTEYYKLYGDCVEINFDMFLTQFCTNWHAADMTNDDMRFFKAVILNIKNAELEEAESALLGLINKQFIETVNKIGTKPFDAEDIRNELDKYENKRAGIIQDFDRDYQQLKDIRLSEADATDGIPYAHPPLQQALYGQVKGDFILVNADVGLGKSAFILTQMVHTFKWLHENKERGPILFFNSEGSVAQAFGRVLSLLYKDKVEDGYRAIIKNEEKILQHFFKTYDESLLKIFRSNGKGIGFIRSKIKKYKPSVVFIDMLKGATCVGKNESEVASVESFGQQLRDLSASSCPIWATVQAGDSCKYYCADEGVYKWKRWLEMRDVYGTKTGLQGAASTIIGIGCDNPEKAERYIKTSKVKSEYYAQYMAVIEPKWSNYRVITSAEVPKKEEL